LSSKAILLKNYTQNVLF